MHFVAEGVEVKVLRLFNYMAIRLPAKTNTLIFSSFQTKVCKKKVRKIIIFDITPYISD